MTADQAQALISGSSVGSNGTAISAGDGSGFVATNPTPGTPIVFAVTTAYSATAGAYMAMKNTSPDGGKHVWLNYIKLLTNVVPASSTSWQFAYYVDAVGSNRWTSGGSVIVPVNPNGGSSTSSQVQLYVGALTTAAAGSSARLVARGTLRGVVPTIFDEYVIDFGGSPGGSLASAAASGRVVVNAPQVVIGPQQWGLLHMWGAANGTAGQFEFEKTWIEVAPAV